MAYIVTTSHRPSQRTRSFVKELASVLPRGLRVTRGKKTLQDLYLDALEIGAKRVIVVGERRGNPGLMRFYRPEPPRGLEMISELVLKGVTLAREIRARPPRSPRSIGVLLGGPEELEDELVDALVESFAARLLLGGEKADICIVARRRQGVLETRFTDPLGRTRGPVIRVRRVRAWRGSRPQ